MGHPLYEFDKDTENPQNSGHLWGQFPISWSSKYSNRVYNAKNSQNLYFFKWKRWQLQGSPATPWVWKYDTVDTSTGMPEYHIWHYLYWI